MDWLGIVGAEGFNRLCDFALGKISSFIDKKILIERICEQLEVEKKKHKTASGDQNFEFSFDSFSQAIVNCFSDAKTLELLLDISKDHREEETKLIISRCMNSAKPKSYAAERYIESAVYDFCELLYEFYYRKTTYDQRARDMRIVDSINAHTHAEIDSLKKELFIQQKEHEKTLAISETCHDSYEKTNQYSLIQMSEQDEKRTTTEHEKQVEKEKTLLGLTVLALLLVFIVFLVWSYWPTILSEMGIVINTTPNSDTVTSGVDTSSEVNTDTSSHAPEGISLLSLTPWTNMPFVEADYSMEDIFGTQYDNCIYSMQEKSDGISYCTYRLDYRYINFQFLSGIVSYGRGDPGVALIRVLGDGKELYSRELTCESDSLEVKLDVSGVKDLTLELYGVSEPEVSLRGSTTLYPALFNPILKPANNPIG